MITILKSFLWRGHAKAPGYRPQRSLFGVNMNHGQVQSVWRAAGGMNNFARHSPLNS